MTFLKKRNYRIIITAVLCAVFVTTLLLSMGAVCAASKKDDKKEKKSQKERAQELVSKAADLMAQGENNKAAPLLAKARKIYPKNPDAWILLADIYVSKSKYNYALGTYQKALKHSPDSVKLLFNYAHTLGKIGKHKRAVKYFDRIIKKNPDFAPAYKYKGYSFIKMYKFKHAATALENALAIKPDDYRAMLMLGITLKQTGNPQKGRELIQKALQGKPELKNELPALLKQDLGV